jgi:hypothetical protein
LAVTTPEVALNAPVLSSWTPQALEVLSRSCDHYGGLAAFRTVRKIRLIPERFSGLLLWFKGLSRTFQIPEAFEVFPHERMARFVGYPFPEHAGVFQNGVVRIVVADDGAVVTEKSSHRASFGGLAKYRRWSPLDFLYFLGYALTHYHSLPFSLSEARLLARRTLRTRDGNADVLDVELPADLPTHCRRQQFYFDAQGRITRHDYQAEIAGFWARGAHFWRRQTAFDGLPIALDRHVVARLGTMPVPITALHGTFRGAEVERGER